MEVENDLNLDYIVDNFNSDNEEEQEELMINQQQHNNISQQQINAIYNINIYNFNIYNYFKEKQILKANIYCPTCNQLMIESNNKDYIDGICLRCLKNNPKHDIKKSIRTESFLEVIKIDLISIYVLLYDCFIYNKSVNKSYIDYIEFTKHINCNKISEKNLGKFFQLIRKKIKESMHEFWKNNMLGQSPSIDGVPRIEID